MINRVRAALVRAAAAATAAFMFAGAASAGAYVDTSFPDLKPEERVTVASPQPVQLLFQFQTKGAANNRATKFLRDEITTTATDAGVFSAVGDGPAANGAILSITINNVPSENAGGKGVITGLTFGLKGSTVADYYDCSFDYVPADGAPKVTKTLRHTIYFTIGATGEPANAVKVKNLNEAVKIMARQAVSHGLNQLAGDPVFAGTTAAAPTATAEPPPVPSTAPEAQPAAPTAPVAPEPAAAPADPAAAPAAQNP